MRIAESSTEILKMKIDDILDFYEVESGNFAVREMKFDVRNQCKELESIFLPLMNEKRTDLKFFVNEQTPKLVVHDACRIHKILVNLISNSVKYTKNGKIITTIDWKETQTIEHGKVSEIKYTVTDTGIGIINEKKRTLFKFLDADNFRDVDIEKDSKTSTTPLAGTGLGISQKIAFALGTKIEYTSTPKVGSSFWFTVRITAPYVPMNPMEKEACSFTMKMKENNMENVFLNPNNVNQGKLLAPNGNKSILSLVKRNSSVLSMNRQSVMDEVPEE